MTRIRTEGLAAVGTGLTMAFLGLRDQAHRCRVEPTLFGAIEPWELGDLVLLTKSSGGGRRATSRWLDLGLASMRGAGVLWCSSG
jgi:hypothetical protein